MFEYQVASIKPAGGSVITGLETPAASAVYLTIQAAPLVHSFTLLPANVQASSILLQCCCLLEKSFHSPAPATRLSSWSPASEHSSSHLLDSWGALWWTGSSTDSANRLRRPLSISTSMALSPKLLHYQKPFSHHSMFHP